jgi:hypothetical protein
VLSKSIAKRKHFAVPKACMNVISFLNILQSSVPTKNYSSIALHSPLSASCSSICNPSIVADDEVDLMFQVLGTGKNQEDSTKDLCDRNGFSLSNCKRK